MQLRWRAQEVLLIDPQGFAQPLHAGSRGIRAFLGFIILDRVSVAAHSLAGLFSGTPIRGQHIHNPRDHETPIVDVMSITVVGPNVYEADRFATAAFAMGSNGIAFIARIETSDPTLLEVAAVYSR